MNDISPTSKNRRLSKGLIVIILAILVCSVVGIVIFANKPKPTINPQSNKPPVSVEPKSENSYGNLSGKWTGTWTNSLGEKGDETLEITNDGVGNFHGVWSGNINVTGQWLDKTNFKFSGQTSTRDYQAQGILQDNTLYISYTATRLNTSGSYTGKESLMRVSP